MWVVLVGLLVLADEPKKAGPEGQELKKLAGRWSVVEETHGGKKTDVKKLAALAVRIDGKRLTIRDGTEVREESSISLDPKAKPAALDLKITSGADAGKVVKGIYKLEGGTLTVCVAEPGKDRPGEFAAREGTGWTLFVFKRAKK
jgi:uncharacterized protein (TIGR03067 family)